MNSAHDDARTALRSMWQLPAAWRVLRLLARPLALPAPSPQALEDALINPADHAQIVANMHGRILGLSAGKASDARWIATTARFMRAFPGTFGPILGYRHQARGVSSLGEDGDAAKDQNGDDAHMVSSDYKMLSLSLTKADDDVLADDRDATPATEKDGDDDAAGPMELQVFKTMDEYAALAPSVRLLVLQSIAEMVICEHDTLLQSGNFADVEADELRLEPVGVDAVGSVYWYFGDECSLYREPNERISRSLEKRLKETAAAVVKSASEAALEQQKRERNERKLALKQSKEEKWAPRVAATRSTRASLAKEREIMQESSERTQSARHSAVRSADSDQQRSLSVDHKSSRPVGDGDPHEVNSATDVHQRSGDGDSRNMSRDFDRDSGAENLEGRLTLTPQSQVDSGLRRSGRARKESQIYLERHRTSTRKRASSPNATPGVNSSAQIAKKPRRALKQEFQDSSLRNCAGWERVCTGPDELRAFIARFGHVKELSHAAESALVHRLQDELLPILDDASDRIKREEEKRMRAEWLASNVKKSSRVTALEQKREQEQALAAAKAAEEMRKEKQLVERECLIESGILRLEKDIVRELRLARRKLETSSGDERPGSVAAMSREERAHRRLVSVAQGGSGSDAVLSDCESPAAGTDVVINSETAECNYKAAKTLVSDFERATENSGSFQDHHVTRALELSAEGNAPANSLSPGNEAACLKPLESGRRSRTSTAVLEKDIPATYTWIVVADDNLPTRALTHFVFVRASDLSLAPLEEASIQNDVVDNGRGADVFGYGIIIPPTTSDAAPLRVELGQILEWVIEYGTEPRLWVKTKLAWYELKNPLSDYSKTFSTALRKFEICSRLRILAQTFRGDQLDYENVVQLLSMRYMNMRGYREQEIDEEIPFVLEQVQTLGKASLLKSGFIRELEKKQRDAIKNREKEAQRVARDEERARQVKIRAEKREAEKARLRAERVAASLERSRLAEERKRRRFESSSTKLKASRRVEDRRPPSGQSSGQVDPGAGLSLSLSVGESRLPCAEPSDQALSVPISGAQRSGEDSCHVSTSGCGVDGIPRNTTSTNDFPRYLNSSALGASPVLDDTRHEGLGQRQNDVVTKTGQESQDTALPTQMADFPGDGSPISSRPAPASSAEYQSVSGLARAASVDDVDIRGRSPQMPTSEVGARDGVGESMKLNMIALVPAKTSDVLPGEGLVLLTNTDSNGNEGPSSDHNIGLPERNPNRDADRLLSQDHHVVAGTRAQEQFPTLGPDLPSAGCAAVEQESGVSLVATQPALFPRSVGHGLWVSASSCASGDGDGEHLPVPGSNSIYIAPGGSCVVQPSPVNIGHEVQNDSGRHEPLPSQVADMRDMPGSNPGSTGQFRVQNLNLSSRTVEAIHSCPNGTLSLYAANEIAGSKIHGGSQPAARSSACDPNLAVCTVLSSPSLSRKVANSNNSVALGSNAVPPQPDPNRLHESVGQPRCTAPNGFGNVLSSLPNVADHRANVEGKAQQKRSRNGQIEN